MSNPNVLLGEKPKKKRNRLILSCMFCRERKLKCDQVKPVCGSCSSRNLTSCVYIQKTNSIEAASPNTEKRAKKKVKISTSQHENVVTPPIDSVTKTVDVQSRNLNIADVLLKTSTSYLTETDSTMPNILRNHSANQIPMIKPIVPRMNNSQNNMASGSTPPYLQNIVNQNNTPISETHNQTAFVLPASNLQHDHNNTKFVDSSQSLYSPQSNGHGTASQYSYYPYKNRMLGFSKSIKSPTSYDRIVHSNEGHPSTSSLPESEENIKHFKTLTSSIVKVVSNPIDVEKSNSSLLKNNEIAYIQKEPPISKAFSLADDQSSKDFATSKNEPTDENKVSKEKEGKSGLGSSCSSSCNSPIPTDNGDNQEKDKNSCPYIHPFTLGFEGSREPDNPLKKYVLVVASEEACFSFGATSADYWLQNNKFMTENESIWNSFKLGKEIESKNEVNGLSGVFRERYAYRRLHQPNLIKELALKLPKFSVFKQKIQEYFLTIYHSYTQFIDEKVVLDILDDLIVYDATTDLITEIKVTEQTNFFSIGILLSIYAIVEGNSLDDLCFTEFFCFLRGISAGLTFSMKKIQFLLLNMQHREFDIINGEEIYMGSNFLMSESIAAMTSALGLRNDIKKHFHDKTEHVGKVSTMESIWYWSLYADLKNSFDFGKTLSIPYGSFNELELQTEEKGRIPMFKRFIYLGRKMVYELNKPKGIPDIDGMLYQIENFLECELQPVHHYCDSSNFGKIDMFEYFILGRLLFFKSTLQFLRMNGLHKKDMNFEKKFLKTLFLVLNLLLKFTEHCAFLKNLNGEAGQEWASGNSIDNVRFWFKKCFSCRLLPMFFDIIYEMAKTEKGDFAKQNTKNENLKDVLNYKLSDKEIDFTKISYSASDIFEKYSDIMDKYLNVTKKEFNNNSVVLTGCFDFKSFEIMCRSVYMNSLEIRKSKKPDNNVHRHKHKKNIEDNSKHKEKTAHANQAKNSQTPTESDVSTVGNGNMDDVGAKNGLDHAAYNGIPPSVLAGDEWEYNPLTEEAGSGQEPFAPFDLDTLTFFSTL